MGKFDTDKWKYVQVVPDSKKSEFQFFADDSRDLALNAKAIKGKFQRFWDQFVSSWFFMFGRVIAPLT